jgi:outer membrane protein assembly factor BamB
MPMRAHHLAACVLALSPYALAQWTTLTGSDDRVAVSDLPFPSLASPSWVCSADMNGNTIHFVAPSSVVVFEDMLLAVGRVRPAGSTMSQYFLFAICRVDGTVQWQAPLSRSAYAFPISSYSTPTIDPIQRTVLVASGASLLAFALEDGRFCWSADLANLIVNACAVVTSGSPQGDLAPANRAFITDFDGASGSGFLYCINVDPFDASQNPFQQGEIVWSAPLPGVSGNTPAYARGKVFIASTGVQNGSLLPAEVRCYDAAASEPSPLPLWTWTSPFQTSQGLPEGFFGGVCVRGPTTACDSWALYAATYNFTTTGSSYFQSHLVKLDADSGVLLWQTPTLCNRTNSIPIPLDDGRIVLSGGIAGFGTLPTIEVFQDHCSSASRLWDSVSATWVDSDHDAVPDPGEYLLVGGRTQQPIISTRGGSPALLVPTPPFNDNQDDTGFSTALQVLDLDADPRSLGFVRDQFVGAGSSPALAGRNLYTIGQAGLFAFGPTPARLDVDDDKHVTIDDLLAWEQGEGLGDVDRDGALSPDDRDALREGLRLREPSDMASGR